MLSLDMFCYLGGILICSWYAFWIASTLRSGDEPNCQQRAAAPHFRSEMRGTRLSWLLSVTDTRPRSADTDVVGRETTKTGWIGAPKDRTRATLPSLLRPRALFVHFLPGAYVTKYHLLEAVWFRRRCTDSPTSTLTLIDFRITRIAWRTFRLTAVLSHILV